LRLSFSAPPSAPSSDLATHAQDPPETILLQIATLNLRHHSDYQRALSLKVLLAEEGFHAPVAMLGQVVQNIENDDASDS
jgi:hypothetical protein